MVNQPGNNARVHLEDFAEKLSRILPVLIREFARRQSNELYQGKITMQQFVALGYLSYRHAKEGSTMGEIAKALFVTMPAATGVIDRLIRAGYCERAADASDRRIIRIKITSKGENLVKKIYKQRKAMIIRIFAKISPLDREEYLRILTKVGEVLKEEK